MVELPGHTGMFSLICSMGQVVFQEATKFFKKYFALQVTKLLSPARAPEAHYQVISPFATNIWLSYYKTAVKGLQRTPAHLLP